MREIVIKPQDNLFALTIKGKTLKTPLGKPLLLPNEKLAQEIAHEWAAQGDKINKSKMPLNQIACIALDLVAEKKSGVLADILPYLDTDSICYRAGDISKLFKQQNELLNPIVKWAEEKFAIKLNVTTSVMPISQYPENQPNIMRFINKYNDWQLAVFVSLVKPLASIILALALIEGRIDGKTAFQLSHLEEIYETEKWGEDDEKEATMQQKQREILAAEKFLSLLD